MIFNNAITITITITRSNYTASNGRTFRARDDATVTSPDINYTIAALVRKNLKKKPPVTMIGFRD